MLTNCIRKINVIYISTARWLYSFDQSFIFTYAHIDE